MAARIQSFTAIEPAGTEPAPLVPPDLEMERCPWMKLDVTRFLSSRFAVECTSDAAFRAGFTLMLKSWHMTPAGSLPNDDRVLVRLIGGISLARWRKIKPQALAGFVLCNDGRLYCPFVCREALEAAEELARADERRERERSRKSGGTPAEASPHTGQDETRQIQTPCAPLAAADPIRPPRRHLRRHHPASPAPSTPAPAAGSEDAIRWRNRLAGGPGGLWLASWGPKPGEAGCEVPVELVAASAWREAMAQSMAVAGV